MPEQVPKTISKKVEEYHLGDLDVLTTVGTGMW